MKLQSSRIHFIGVGGIGMCGLAEILKNMGAQVSGSDLSENANTEHLKKIGVQIFKGHAAHQVSDVDVVVYSSAVKNDNPEFKEARRLQIPLIPRAEALAELMRLKRGIAVAGTHGKTTTTSLTAAIFLQAQLKPTIVVGGRLDLIKSTAQLGLGDWLIAEADESDGSFNRLNPEIAIITNIDSDHLDYFKNFENLQKAFLDFALRVPFYGAVIACGDDAMTKEVLKDFPKKVFFYGFGTDNDFILRGSKGHYQLQDHRKILGEFDIHVPGKHNALNATAAIVAGMTAGIPAETCFKGIAQFQGVDRRFHFKGEKSGVSVYDDYGHHPTEVKAVIQGFKEKFPDRKLNVLFQPHRFTRTEHCWPEFIVCFEGADRLFITDIYPAGEAPIPGIDSQRLVVEIQRNLPTLKVEYLSKNSDLTSNVRKHLSSGDVFVTLGAGDVWKIGMEILK